MSDMGDEVTAHSQLPLWFRVAHRSHVLLGALGPDNGIVAQCGGQTGQGLPRCA
jgi:hypothetical protein